VTTNPCTGRPYRKGFFTLSRVRDLLLCAAVEVSDRETAAWNQVQLDQAGDWALRAHLRAGDNLNRVPPRPPHVPDFRPLNHGAGSVMDL
jgi:hypothetical protein